MALPEPDARPAGIGSRGLGAVIDLIVVLLVIGMLYERRHTRDLEAFGGLARRFVMLLNLASNLGG